MSFSGYQIQPFDNPADFFMDITNGEAKSTIDTPSTGTLYKKHTHNLFGDLWMHHSGIQGKVIMNRPIKFWTSSICS